MQKLNEVFGNFVNNLLALWGKRKSFLKHLDKHKAFEKTNGET
jgi:hypothetical protein